MAADDFEVAYLGVCLYVGEYALKELAFVEHAVLVAYELHLQLVLLEYESFASQASAQSP